MGCTNVKPYCIYFWPVSDVPSEASADRTRVGTPRNLRRIRCESLFKRCNLLMVSFIFRDKWPAEVEEPENLDGSHDEYGVLVMHDDDDGRCPDAGQ